MLKQFHIVVGAVGAAVVAVVAVCFMIVWDIVSGMNVQQYSCMRWRRIDG